jgi:hypothetical protein
MQGTSVRSESGFEDATLDARRLLFPYSLSLIALCVALQLYIVFDDNRIGPGAIISTAVIGIYCSAFAFVRRRELGQIRFGHVVAHAVTYAALSGSFQLHAAFLGMTGSDALSTVDNDLPVAAGWFGMTYSLAGYWAIVLVLHVIASVAKRGFES